MSSRRECRCNRYHEPRWVVLTGGPGGGKTAVLEVVRKQFCDHVVVLPESATIIFSGGFPRGSSTIARRAAQLAIFHVQDQLEQIEAAEGRAAVVLCDRGVVDGAAYWPGTMNQYWEAVGQSEASALARYDAVIHLRPPRDGAGYGTNQVRIETAEEAYALDEKILGLWQRHPHRTVIESQESFVVKLERALAAIDALVPECCRH
jgi:predicted ATPase